MALFRKTFPDFIALGPGRFERSDNFAPYCDGEQYFEICRGNVELSLIAARAKEESVRLRIPEL
jgi:hypothetical protein